MHEQMVRIRVFESEAGRLIEAGRLPGFLHLSVGQEAVAVGVISVLGPDDQVTSTHRGHGHAIAKGADMTAMYAELFGKSTGSCGGMGGSMHINDTSLGMLGANGVVGAGIPIAVGSAFASWYRGESRDCGYATAARKRSTRGAAATASTPWRPGWSRTERGPVSRSPRYGPGQGRGRHVHQHC
jgi:TPP-dependent pyruvate/acetoin dehydrogenase alpha subunit